MSDERRVHRPFDPGDLDLDARDQLDRGLVLLAAVRGGVPTATRLAVQGEQLVARAGQRRRVSGDGSWEPPVRTMWSVPEAGPSGLDGGERLAADDLVGRTDHGRRSRSRRSARRRRAPSSSPRGSRSDRRPRPTAPTATWTVRTAPGIGATISAARPCWAWLAAARAARSTSGGGASRNGTLRPSTSTYATPSASATVESLGRRSGRDGAGHIAALKPHLGRPRSAASRRPTDPLVRGARGRRRPSTTRHPGRSPARPSRPAARCGRACPCGPRRPGTTGWRTSQRRNRRFVTTPRTTVSSRAAARRSQRLGAIVAVGDDLRQHRVEARADLGAQLDPGVDPDPGAGRPAQRLDPPGRRQEAVLGVLGVQADLDRHGRSRRCRDWSTPSGLAGGDPQLVRDEVPSGHGLGHRVLHLESGVHLQEGRLPALRDEELARAGADVADLARRGSARRPSGGSRRSGVTDRATASPRGSSGDAAGASSRVRRGARRSRAHRTGPGPRRGARPRPGVRGRAGRRRTRPRPRVERPPARPRTWPGSRTTCMPLPPPPADGLMTIG